MADARLLERPSVASDDVTAPASLAPADLESAVVAVPDRHERLYRHAAPRPAAGPPDGPRPGVTARRVPPRVGAARGHLDNADRRRPGRARAQRPSRGRAVPRVDPPGVRDRPAAPPRPPAGRAHPLRGPALAGRRGR